MKLAGGHLSWLIIGLLLLAACKPKIPEQFIQPDEMEDLLYDYHIAQGMASQGDGDFSYKSHLYFEAALKKHHVTQAEFDSSLVYYYTRADRFIDIYKRVQERLGDEAVVLGASTSEVERYITQSQTGDTLDVWEGSRRQLLIPTRPYQLLQFTQEADTSYHAGDSFLMTFTNTYLVQNSSKHADAYLAVTYANDSTVSRTAIVSSTGETTIRIPACKYRVKRLSGFVCLGQRPDPRPSSNEVCLLFLDRIQLIRFHHKTPEQPEAETVAPMKLDTVARPDTSRRVRRLGERPMSVGDGSPNVPGSPKPALLERIRNRQGDQRMNRTNN